MDTDAKGQLGGIECSAPARKKMATDSGAFKCSVCNKTNKDIIQEREEAAALIEPQDGQRQEEEVPEELRLAYRDELSKGSSSQDAPKESKGKEKAHTPSIPSNSTIPSSPGGPSTATSPPPTRTTQHVPAPTVQRLPPEQQSPDNPLAWIDTCIYGVLAALLYMVLKRFM